MIREKEVYSYLLAFTVMLAMSITIYFLTREDDSENTRVFNRESFVETEVKHNRKNFSNSHKLGLEINRVELEIVKMSSELEQVSLEYSKLVEEMEVIKNNLDWLNKTTAFGAYTRVMLQELPQKINLESLQDYRSQVNIRIYEISKAVRTASVFHEEDSKSPEHVDLEKLRQLISLYKALSNQIDTLIAVSGDYSIALEEARSFLKEREVWAYSNAPIWENILDLDSKRLFGVTSPVNAISQNIDLEKVRLSLIYFVTFSLILFFLNRWLRLKLDLISLRQKKVFGNPLKDSFYNSIIVLTVTFFASSILPAFLFTCVWFLDFNWLFYPSILFDEIMVASCALLWSVGFLYHLSRKQGMLELHFRWSKEICHTIHHRIRVIMFPLFIILLSFYFFRLVAQEHDAEIMRILYLFVIALLFILYKSLLNLGDVNAHLPAFFQSGVGFYVIYYSVIGSFFVVAAMAMLGLYVGSWKILILQQLNVFALIGVFLVYQLGERWLILEQRQLSYQRFLAKREEKIARENEGVSEDTSILDAEEQGLDKESISEQSMTLLKGLSLILLVTVLSTIWSSQLELTNWMDDVVLWQASPTANNGVEVVDITLKSLMYALLALVISFVSIRNIPGLLELLVLRRMSLAPGTGYTITTLLRYIILMLGIVIAFTTIGIEWDRLQWLIAAIGVGLGFGLQEIFANFISGLILLFERPIRIGDTVTINDLSGTVSKIQTRSTTIIDWDNKEIVVPNKVFITDKLINWSLTDSVTRVVIPIGVAYGSDVDLVEELLYRAVEDTSLVLSVPAPRVYFLTFGDSSLEFELRLHINSIDDRLPTLHLVNKKINRLFKENDIEIAFPQIDVHIKRSE
ncbi:mechanosensitive ion channel domain-containing protein [Vibrio parahaemolyticus]|uniref:mechanosensitive ion channel domain-containing protein n=3 Tax=Vibrio parahaemolyticus TaxID=670 RepID=UPI000417F083|nr:mechanosensitive ion channel domain-containing protein [Vibrio parahaemolyticus]EGQ9353784.1 mechanosensitive ion channel [Vibrio parahaemolyticus]EGQ9512962.1 mechanosensitive ion channel [Vibrio parahaemolyticus]EGR1564901.1 mechanosensitive ion channel protein MscS [Vibrio parahaemolyticus]EGR1588676.1 mechanosensitive ion channel protein MscS [Vibrio parahaemolyticus]EGR3154805.1 mechanosensitive ion channel protein MscS [Vibrio parahaemolyticus]